MKNKPLTKYRKRKIIDCFSLELTATQTAEFLKINRNTVNRYFMLIRKSIADYQHRTNPVFDGEVELDESYFGSRHKGNVGRSVKS